MAGQQNKPTSADVMYEEIMAKINAQAEEIIAKAQAKATEILDKAGRGEKVTELTEDEKKQAEELQQLVRVKLPRIKDKGDVFVAVNGHSFLIKRGVAVEVPLYIAKALEDSEEQENVAYDLIEKLSGQYDASEKDFI